jgi:hypothetical protein
LTVPDRVDVTIDRRRFAGVWTNACRAITHADEVTIDFIRVDPREPSGLVRDLMDELERVWHDRAWRTQPPPEEA